MNIYRKILRVINFLRVTTAREFVTALFHHFAKGDLQDYNPPLYNLLIFAVSCADKNYQLSGQDELLTAKVTVNNSPVFVSLRKFSRDLCVFEQVFLQQDYLPLVAKLRSAEQQENGRFIVDAGANIGCATLFIKAYFPDAQIICIEPEKSNFELLMHNLKRNKFDKGTTSLRKALWNKATTLNLQQRDQSHDAFHVMEKLCPDEVVDCVETCTLAQIMETCRQQQIDLLKIDIEGAEKTLFEDHEGLNTFLPRTRMLAVEIHEEFISQRKIKDILSTYWFQTEQSGEYTIAYNSTEK
jgi:FkbM family methyltransferase